MILHPPGAALPGLHGPEVPAESMLLGAQITERQAIRESPSGPSSPRVLPGQLSCWPVEFQW